MNKTFPEVWAPIPGFERFYEVSTHGQVRRLSRASAAVRKIHPKRDYAPKLLKQIINTGYRYVHLWAPPNTKRASIHSLVLETFVGPRPRGFYGCHKDGNRGNNCVTNLKWASPVENQEDRVRHGRNQYGEKNGSHKFSDKVVAAVKAERAATGATYKQLGRMFDMCPQHAHFICTGKTRANSVDPQPEHGV